MTSWVARVRTLGRGCAELSAAVGLLGLLGWVGGAPVLRTWDGATGIEANAALCLALLGFAALAPARLRVLGALSALAIAVATLSEHATGRSLGLDALLAPAATRMSALTAGALALLAAGTLALDRRARGVHLSELAAAGAGLVGLLALLDRVLGAGLTRGGVALPTAAGLLLLAVSLCAARPTRGAMEALTSPRLGGALLRRALVPVVLLTGLQVLAIAHGQGRGWITPAGALAVTTLGALSLVAAILARTAALLDRADLSRAAALAELEERIAQRTAALEEERAALARARDEALAAARAMASTADLSNSVDAILDTRALDLAPFEIAQVVQAAVDPSRPRALRQRVQLSTQLQPAVPHRLTGDARRVQQVLAHLVANAVRFTDSGPVRVEVSAPAATDLATRVRFAVVDSGPGIAPERLPELFRAAGAPAPGLALAARLVELMDGRIGVDSKVGAGSTFWFEVPLARAAQRPAADGVRVRGLAAAIGPAALRRSAQVFLDYLDPLLEQIDAAVRAHSAAEIQLAAHRLKGSAASFGADALAAACVEFEKYARANMTAPLPERLPALRAAAAQARADLTRWLEELDPTPVRLASNA